MISLCALYPHLNPFRRRLLFPSIPNTFLSFQSSFLTRSCGRLSLSRKCASAESRNFDFEDFDEHEEGFEDNLEDGEEDDEEEGDDEDDEEFSEEYEDDMLPFQQIEDDDDDVVLSSWSEESKRKRVDRLRNAVKEFGSDIIDVDELASIYGFKIDKFQRLAVEAFLRGSSVVVSAPTSSGKTLIAEAAAVATVTKGRRIFYTTPLKALSNQKFRDFRDTFGDDTVGLLTGDTAINKDGQVLVMTTEILRNMMYNSIGLTSSESRLFGVDVIVLDEVHFLSDISRGTVWEEIVIYCPKEVQLICLSATVKNPDELAGWINEVHGKTELVTSLRRPVPLTWHFSTKVNLFPLLEDKGKQMNRKLTLNYYSNGRRYSEDKPRRKNWRNRRFEDDISFSRNDLTRIRRSQVPQVVDTLYQLKERNMLPAVWFIFNRRGCDASVQYVENCRLLEEHEVTQVELAIKMFTLQNPDAVRENAVKALLNGVASHHAGCLPIWKTFIEELFQRGLIKLVFATETLAAGINMPARTAVISSLSKRSGNGRTNLTPNELLQMAGRAGRRGIDNRGHVVLIQTPNEGAEDCVKLLFSGLDPLVSQFTASYGMVLNLLAGTRVTRKEVEQKAVSSGRTLKEARMLVEKSFGTYLGSNVMVGSKEELGKIEKEIEMLVSQITEEAIDRRSKQFLSERAYVEISDLQSQLLEQKRRRTELRRMMENERITALKSLLQETESNRMPFICLQYKDSSDVEHVIPSIFIGKTQSFTDSGLGQEFPEYYVALGSDNTWYLFTEKWVKSVYAIGFPNVPRETMWGLLGRNDRQWEKLSSSENGDVYVSGGSLETWSWSLNVPVVHSLEETDEVKISETAYNEALETYKEQRNVVSRMKKRIARTEGFKEYKKVMEWKSVVEDKIRRLRSRGKRLQERMSEIEPSGWKEFVKISKVVQECKALDLETQVIFPLGETAAAIRGENELWLAMVLRNKILLKLKAAELAGVCASVVSEGIKVRPWGNNNLIYEASEEVRGVIEVLEEQRESLMEVQGRHGVEIGCWLDRQFSGMVEAWASGLTWKEITMDCAMDDGDLARLLRRTIDVLSQIPKLPDIDPALQTTARAAAQIMDRPPISELAS